MRIKNFSGLLATALIALTISACGDKPAPAPAPTPKVEMPAPKTESPAPAPKADVAAPAQKAQAPAAAVQIVAGKDYQNLRTPQSTVNTTNVEVLEFFWYGCPHCDHLQPALHEWLKRKPADVTFRRQPAAFQDSWVQLARTYYAMDAIDATDKLHREVFNAIHRTKALNPATLGKDQNPLFDWVATQGVDRKKFVDAYNSFGVATKSQRTMDITSAYDISGTPSIVVDGRYLTAPSMMPPNAGNSVDYALFFGKVDQLIAMARKNRGGK